MHLIVFDLDGTLVDSYQDIHDALRYALRRSPAGRVSEEADEAALRAGCHGLPLQRFFALARPGADEAAMAPFIDAYRERYYSHLLDTTRPFPGVSEGLALLREAPVRMAVATTKMTETARRVTQGLGLHRYFDLVLGSDDLPCKPDPAILHEVSRQLGLPRPHGGLSGMMVGDTDHDVVAGRRAGLRTCAVGWSYQPREHLLAAEPDHHAVDFAAVVALALSFLSGPAAQPAHDSD